MPILTGQEYAVADLQKAFSNYSNTAVSVSATFEMNVVQWNTDQKGGLNIAYEVIFQNTATQYNQIVLNIVSSQSDVSAEVTENVAPERRWHHVDQLPFVHAPQDQRVDEGGHERDHPKPERHGSERRHHQLRRRSPARGGRPRAPAPIQGGTPTVHLGIGYVLSPTSSEWSMSYDNFAVNFALLN